MKIKLLAIILSAVLVVGGGTAVGVAVVENTPENVAIEAITGVFEDLPQREELAPLVAMFNGGSLEFSVSEISSEGVNLLDDGEIKGKFYFDEQEFMLKDFNIAINDFALSGDVYASSDMFYIKENDIFDESIGFKKGEIADALEDSIFASDSGSEYALPSEIYDMLMKLAEQTDNPKNEDMAKDAQKLLEQYSKDAYKIFCDNVDFVSQSEEVRLDGERVSARVVTITVGGDDMAEIIDEMYDYINNDKAIIKFLDKYEELLRPSFEEFIDEDDDRSLSEMFLDMLEDGENEVDYIVEGLERQEDEELVIELVTPKLTSKLLKFTMAFENQELFSVDFGTKGVLKTDKIIVTADYSTYVYEIEENSSDKLESSFTVDGYKVVSFEINREKDTYSLKFEDFSIKGDIKTSGKKTTITIDKIIAYDEIVSTDITIVIDESDNMPKPDKKFTTIDEITEEDIEKWIDDFSEAISDIGQSVDY